MAAIQEQASHQDLGIYGDALDFESSLPLDCSDSTMTLVPNGFAAFARDNQPVYTTSNDISQLLKAESQISSSDNPLNYMSLLMNEYSEAFSMEWAAWNDISQIPEGNARKLACANQLNGVSLFGSVSLLGLPSCNAVDFSEASPQNIACGSYLDFMGHKADADSNAVLDDNPSMTSPVQDKLPYPLGATPETEFGFSILNTPEDSRGVGPLQASDGSYLPVGPPGAAEVKSAVDVIIENAIRRAPYNSPFSILNPAGNPASGVASLCERDQMPSPPDGVHDRL